MSFDGRFCLERDVDRCIEELKSGKVLAEHTVKFVCARLVSVFAAESNVAEVQAPVSVVGDIHGQFFDLLELFQIGGECPQTNYLFLGDYVDRGPFSVEVISLLCCLKLRYPSRITLLRGNHESRQTTQVYGFYSDCMKKYGSAAVWQYFTDMFDYIPIAALIDGRIFCVHAGLSPSLHSVDQVCCGLLSRQKMQFIFFFARFYRQMFGLGLFALTRVIVFIVAQSRVAAARLAGARTRAFPGSATRRPDHRSDVVGPGRRPLWLPYLIARCWFHFWRRRCRAVGGDDLRRH